VEDNKKRRRMGANAWRDVLQRFAASGESVVAFCKREGLNTNSFRRWRGRLAATPATRPRHAVPRQEAQERSETSFIELGSLGGAGTPGAPAGRLDLKLDLGGGLSLHLVRG
jgi:putative transposase